MEESPPWEAKIHSASQKISHSLCVPKVHYRVQKNPAVPIQTQIHSVHIFLPYTPKIRSNIILPSTFIQNQSFFHDKESLVPLPTPNM
jgi:hypothetical protein